jgi:hypothetical protein
MRGRERVRSKHQQKLEGHGQTEAKDRGPLIVETYKELLRQFQNLNETF